MKMIKAQALMEVAIFGAIIIMLLGVLISYGLRYNYQQKAMQQAFRKSLAKAVVEPGVPIANVLISDEHVPNPSDTFGVGSVNPFTGSAGGILRDYQMSETATDESSLPKVAINIRGTKCPGSYLSPAGSEPPCYYLTAGFRTESNVSEGSLAKYKEIYGYGNIEDQGEGACSDLEETTDPNTGGVVTTCLQPTKNIRIIDSCAGEIIDYGSAVKQCRMIVDSAACEKECNRGNDGPNNPTDCSGICAQSVNVPWYCANYQETNSVTHAYRFPVLEQLFSHSPLKALGPQQDYNQNTLTNSSLKKTEGVAGITTKDNVHWSTQTTRTIITKPYGTTNPNTATTEVTSEVGQHQDKPSETANW